MTERERLIELLDNGCYIAYEEVSGRRTNEIIADYYDGDQKRNQNLQRKKSAG